MKRHIACAHVLLIGLFRATNECFVSRIYIWGEVGWGIVSAYEKRLQLPAAVEIASNMRFADAVGRDSWDDAVETTWAAHINRDKNEDKR